MLDSTDRSGSIGKALAGLRWIGMGPGVFPVRQRMTGVDEEDRRGPLDPA